MPFRKITLIHTSSILFLFGAIISNVIYADSRCQLPAATNGFYSGQSYLFPLTPRFSALGGIGNLSYGLGDLMVPFVGNSQNILYTDFQGKYGNNNTWSGGAGIGVRHIIDNNVILGTYVFGERSALIPNDATFWDLSPGIEMVTRLFDAHVNAYFPVNREYTLTKRSFSTVFSGHTQFSDLLNIYTSVGPGADAEFGYTIPHTHRTRVYAGTYYFAPKQTAHIRGVIAGLSVPINTHLAITCEDSNDNNWHNTFLIGVRLQLGGIPQNNYCNPSVEERLLDRIPRNLGSLGTGLAIPSRTRIEDTHEMKVVNTAVWFFRPGGTIFDPALGTNQGTIDDPLSNTSFNTATLNSINLIMSNANMYLAPGDYTVSTTSPSVTFNGLIVNSGQSIYGRTFDFLNTAPAGNRPDILGSMELPGNNIVSDVNMTGIANQSSNQSNSVLNNNTALLGLYIPNASNVMLNNMSISGYTAANGTATNINGVDAIGVDIENSTGVVLNNVSVSSIAAGNGFGATGIGGAAAGILTSNSSVTANGGMAISKITGGAGVGNDAKNNDGAFGLYATNASTVTANNGIFINLLTGGNGDSLAVAGPAIGIESDTNSVVNATGGISVSQLTGGSNTNTGSNAGAGGAVIGIQAFGGTVNAAGGINISTLRSGDNSKTTGGFQQAFGIVAFDNGVINSNGTITINNVIGGNGTTAGAHGSPAYGIYIQQNSSVAVTNGGISINSIAGGQGSGTAAGGNGTGIFQLTNAKLTVTNGSITINNISSGGGGATAGVASAFGINSGGVSTLTVTNGGINITNIVGGNGTGTGNGDNAFGIRFSGVGNTITATSIINIDTVLGGHGVIGGSAAGVQNSAGNTISAFTATNIVPGMHLDNVRSLCLTSVRKFLLLGYKEH